MKIGPLVLIVAATMVVSSVLTFVVFIPTVNNDNVSQILQKRGGQSIPAVILSSDGVRQSLPHIYENHLEQIRLSFVNKSSLEQNHRVISDADQDYLFKQANQGARFDSKTGQMFSVLNFGPASEFSEMKREELILRLSTYSAWCYTDESDSLVCDIPSVASSL